MQAGSRYHENDAAQPDDECACRRKKCRGCPVETQWSHDGKKDAWETERAGVWSF